MNSGSFAAMGAYAAEEDRLRRERQEQSQQQSNPIDAIGKTALAAGAIAAAILGGRRLSRGTKAEPRTGSSGVGLRNTSATVDLSKVDTNALRRAAGRPPVDIAETVVPSRTPPPVERAVPRTNVERLGDVNEFVRQAREERPQGIKFLDLSDEVRTSMDPWTGKETILTPFGSPTVPTVRSQGTSTGGVKPLSPVVPDAVDRLLDDPYILSRVNKEYNVEQEAKELAVDNLLSSNRAEQARQQAQKRRSLTESADEIISSLRSEANTAQAAAQGDFTQEYLKTAGYKDVDTMVDQQVANVSKNTNQTLNAIDAAEDQQTGRVYQQLQRNEDIDLNQVEIMEARAEIDRMIGYEPDAPINQVASQLPDGLPVDQAEGLRQNPRNTAAVSFMEAERERISDELSAKGIAALPRDVDIELAERLGPKASSYGPEYTSQAQAMQTFANTGNLLALENPQRFGLQPVTFETFRPSELNPVTTYLSEANRLEGKAEPTAATRYLASKVVKNIPAEQQRLFDTRPPMSLEGYPSTEIQSAIDPTGIKVNAPGYGVVDIAELRKPVIMGGTARQADDFIKGARQNKQEYIEDFTSKMEGLKQEIYGERKQLALETGKNLRLQQNQARENGQINTVRNLEDQIQTLLKIYNNPESSSDLKGSFSSIGRHRQEGRESIASVNNRLIGAEKENNKQIQELEKKYPTTLANRTGEASRVFGQRNVDTGEFIPETMEVRSDRSDVDLGRKRGSGRNIAEYAGGAPVDYSRGNPGTPPLFRKEGEKLILVKPAGLKSNIRDYDIETGGAPDSFQDDRSGSGRVIDKYGIRPTGEIPANRTLRPSQPVYTKKEIRNEIAMSDEPIRYEEAVKRLGAQPATEAGRQSINASEEIRRIQRSNPPAKAQALVSSFLQQLKGV